MIIERNDNKEYVAVDSNDQFTYFVLYRELMTSHACGDGQFYIKDTDVCVGNSATDYLLYYDVESRRQIDSYLVEHEWRPE